MSDLIEIGFGIIICATGLLILFVALAFGYAIYIHIKDDQPMSLIDADALKVRIESHCDRFKTEALHIDEILDLITNATTVQLEGWVSDANRYKWLKEQVGFVKGATNNLVTIFEDDATYMFMVKVGKYYKCTGLSLDDAIDNAIKAALKEVK